MAGSGDAGKVVGKSRLLSGQYFFLSFIVWCRLHAFIWCKGVDRRGFEAGSGDADEEWQKPTAPWALFGTGSAPVALPSPEIKTRKQLIALTKNSNTNNSLLLPPATQAKRTTPRSF